MPRHDRAPADRNGLHRLYKAAEDTIGPRLPRPVRDVWRRLIGRPPLATPARPIAPPDALPPPPKTLDIVCFPIIAWSFRFQRPQQLMRELGRLDHRVFWIDPDSVKNGSSVRGRRNELGHRVFDVSLAGPTPRDPFRDRLGEADLDSMMRTLHALEREASLANVVAIVQLPFWAPLARRAADELGWTIVYDCMDDHSAFSTNDTAMLEGERWLETDSALVVTTSRRLHERVRNRARRVVSVPNACDYDHFAEAARPLPRPPALTDATGPIIGYVGAISEWFNFDLLRHAARVHPEWCFALVGSTWGAKPHEDLVAAPNVHFLGEQPYEEVPALLAAFDVACIPFELSPLIEATDPVKLYEYLAAGKAVVASRLPELVPHQQLVTLVDTPEEFTASVESALATDGPERREKRAAFARENTWAKRAALLEDAVESSFARASVCIVTWNNLELTHACLDSVLADRTWPDVEVVVVDNASEDETPIYLRELAAREPRVRIVLNDDNRGFAAANNQAIELVTGDYVVLLNNDTVVPRGWLARLIRVLEQDPTIGLVGPVTDGVWNEARVDGVSVAPGEVDAFAASWARDHFGSVLPIGMLAMYCVAARRAVIDAVGPLDERFGIGMFEDDDYAHRVRRAGFRLACAEEVFVHHAGQASFDKLSRKDALWEENRTKFEDKWNTRWRAPGLGTRARTLAHQRALESRLGHAGRAPIVRLGPAGGDETLPEIFAARGHPVLDVRPPAADVDDQTLEADARGRLVSTLPLEAFDFLRGAIVLPCAARAFDLAYFANPHVVYVDEPEADAATRRELLARAEIVVAPASASLPQGTIRIAPAEVESVPDALKA